MRQSKAAAQPLADSTDSVGQLTSPYSAHQSKSWEGGSHFLGDHFWPEIAAARCPNKKNHPINDRVISRVAGCDRLTVTVEWRLLKVEQHPDKPSYR